MHRLLRSLALALVTAATIAALIATAAPASAFQSATGRHPLRVTAFN